jgi:SAM-dependent methyltransferase/uncharacterized protein YbaR (Trm112 family)
MNKPLINVLICPPCNKPLELVSFENGETEHGRVVIDSRGQEVISGILKCDCGKLYPIIDGVPRFVGSGLDSFPEFVSKHHKELSGLGHTKPVQLPVPENDGENDYDNIRKSFSQEWGFFDYDSDKTWGWTLEERKQVVLGELRMSREELAGQLTLDAGCGNGTLSATLTDLGLEVVGIDLNDGLGIAYRNRTKYGANAKSRVQYIQANLVHPPLKQGIFDLVYSSGVIHHTPSSERAFETLARMTKRGGRLYIWVYGKRAFPVMLFHRGGESLKRCLSLRSLLRVCGLIAPFYKLTAATLNLLHIMRFRSRTTREVTLDLFDAFAPRFNHWHSEAEVRSWFEKHGFKNITLTSKVRQGLGMYGDKL